MRRILIIAGDNNEVKSLKLRLAQSGFSCSLATGEDELFKQITKQAPDLVLTTLNSRSGNPGLELAQKIKREKRLPIIALVDKSALSTTNISLDIDDFIVEPTDINELVLRVDRLLQRENGSESGELIKCGDLVIDLARCEVTIKGKPVQLTFKEYELLKFLASDRGRVFTRDTILNRVWGYDYYGGDRTIDVHVRRLRSKIEESTDQTFIETVRNIGYRFKADR